jgi:hypothetical protein
MNALHIKLRQVKICSVNARCNQKMYTESNEVRERQNQFQRFYCYCKVYFQKGIKNIKKQHKTFVWSNVTTILY